VVTCFAVPGAIWLPLWVRRFYFRSPSGRRREIEQPSSH
jgi:hypothetical protein